MQVEKFDLLPSSTKIQNFKRLGPAGMEVFQTHMDDVIHSWANPACIQFSRGWTKRSAHAPQNQQRTEHNTCKQTIKTNF